MQRINRPHPTTAHRRQRGITLIESLVALVISALAILGIVGVQMRTLADTQTAVRRAQAIRLIEDLSERMRVNPNALTQITNFESTFSDKDDEDKSLEIKNGCADGCEPEEQAAFDIASARLRPDLTRSWVPRAETFNFPSSDRAKARIGFLRSAV